jgi:outer membrane protein OmpA-like peptidoglycan-associated protein
MIAGLVMPGDFYRIKERGMLKRFTIAQFSIFILLCQTFLKAQEYGKDLKKIIGNAEQYYDAHDVDASLEQYLLADSLSRGDAYISYQIGRLYCYKKAFTKALPYLEVAKQKNYASDSMNFYLARSCHHAHKFEEALKYYTLYKAQLKHNSGNLAEVNRWIENCNHGKELLRNPVEVKIANLGSTINSEFPDYLPMVSADEKTILFTSRRASSTGRKIDHCDNKYFEDIYISNKDDGHWTKPISAGDHINTSNHDACVALSADGQEMLIYRGNTNNGDLFMSDLHGTEWGIPEALNAHINSKYWEPGGCISSNENVIFFTSDRKGGVGGTDIYYTKKGNNGTFGPAKLLGPQVNTPYDENSPFIHADGKTLYFSSQGHNSMGGFDIFSVTVNLETGEVLSKPENIGYPINTASNDVFFVWSADNKRAYFASTREDSYGDKDIYMLERLVKETPLVLLEGEVRDCETKMPLEAKIVVTDNNSGKLVGVFHSNSSTGKYIIVLPANINYGILVEIGAPGYMFFSKNIDNTQLHNYKEMMEEVCIEKIKTGHRMVLKNVFFDVNKSMLKEESFFELNKLVSLLKENSHLKIKIIGHTDGIGSDEHNQKLSMERSQSIAVFLIANGIKKGRVIAEGIGESVPLAPDDTEEHRQLNRRTEVEFMEQ